MNMRAFIRAAAIAANIVHADPAPSRPRYPSRLCSSPATEAALWSRRAAGRKVFQHRLPDGVLLSVYFDVDVQAGGEGLRYGGFAQLELLTADGSAVDVGKSYRFVRWACVFLGEGRARAGGVIFLPRYLARAFRTHASRSSGPGNAFVL